MSSLLLASLILVSPAESAWASLVGISRDETVVAYREDINLRREDGTTDQFSLIHTHDARSGYRVASFRASGIHRLSSVGRPLKVSKRRLRRDNPRFDQAYSHKRWLSLKKRKAFKKKQAPIDGRRVSLSCASDAPCQQELKGHVAHLLAAPGEKLYFSLALGAPDASGASTLEAGLEAAPGQKLAAKGEFYVSRKGRVSVLVSNFLVRRGQAASAKPQVQIAYSSKPIALARGRALPRARRAPSINPEGLRVRVQDSQYEQAHLRSQQKQAMGKLSSEEKRILRRRQRAMRTMVSHFTGGQ